LDPTPEEAGDGTRLSINPAAEQPNEVRDAVALIIAYQHGPQMKTIGPASQPLRAAVGQPRERLSERAQPHLET
jgi:hypothetical protein